MAARTIPTLPTWTAGMRVTGANLAAMVSYQQFWANPPMFRMHQVVAQSVSNTTWTQITCDTSDFDSDSGRSSSSPYSYTIPAGLSGRWQFGWLVAWSANGNGARASNLYKNGASASSWPSAAAVSSPGVSVGWSDSVSCSAGDVMAVYGWQSSGGALSTAAGTDNFSIFWGRLVSLASP